jgi:hypothetical protein
MAAFYNGLEASPMQEAVVSAVFISQIRTRVLVNFSPA